MYLTEDIEWIRLSDVPNLPQGWQWEAEASDNKNEQDDEQDDQAGEGDPYAQAWGPTTNPVCRGYPNNGHRTRNTAHGGLSSTAAEPTEAERERARAERRDVIESNKA